MKTVFRLHAVKRMARRRISAEDIRHVLDTGTVIEQYPEGKPFPSRLIFGWAGERPLHVVAADDEAAEETIIITAYEPDTVRWGDDLRTRRKR